MRVRDHVVLSTATAAVLYPRLRASVFPAWAASIFIDVDHYLWFSLRNRRLSPRAALVYFTEAEAPQHAGTRVFHHPAVLLLLWLASARWRLLTLPALGMSYHVALDAYHRSRGARSQGLALDRDRGICQLCGAHSADVVAHLWRQPRLLPSYRAEHYVAVCHRCHRAAHERGREAIAPLNWDRETYLQRVRLQAFGHAG